MPEAPEDPAGRVSGRLVARGRRDRPLRAGDAPETAEEAPSNVHIRVTDDAVAPAADELHQDVEEPAEEAEAETWVDDDWDDQEWEDGTEWVDDAAAPEPYPAPDEVNVPAVANATGATPIVVVETEAARRRLPVRRTASMRTVAYGLAIVLLAAAVPSLTWYGWRLIQNSREGVIRGDSNALNSEQLLPFTSTALVMFTKADGTPVSTSMFALTNGDSGGGSVVFLPLDTTVPTPAYGVDRLRTAYTAVGINAFTDAAAQILRQSFSDIVTINPSTLTDLLQPVGSLTVDNPAAITAGASFPAGPVQVAPSQAFAFITASGAQDALGTGTLRQQHFFEAWLAAVSRGGTSAVVGETDNGIGRYLLTMAKGKVDFTQLPVKSRLAPGAFGTAPVLVFDVDDAPARLALAKAVPLPQAPNDSRPAIRLLNGVDHSAISRTIIQRLVDGGGQVALLGANPGATSETTELRYGDRTITFAVQQIRNALGVGKLVIDNSITDPGEITIVVGRDLLDHPPPDLFSTSGTS